MRSLYLLPALLAFALGTTGCVQTAMLPAETLEDGETQASISVDEPGALFIPRLNAQVTRGFGGGDLTANLSATPLSDQAIVGGGLALRSYLTDGVSFEAQLQGTSFSGSIAGLALLGVQTIPPSDGGWYVGGQMGVVEGPNLDVLFENKSGEERTWFTPVVGGTFGYGPINLSSSTTMQLELKANVPISEDEGDAPPVATGLSIGVFGLFE